MTADLAVVSTEALSPVPSSGNAGARTASLDPAAAVARLPLSDDHDPFYAYAIRPQGRRLGH